MWRPGGRWTVVVGAVALVIAGCSGDEGSPETSSTVAETTLATTRPAETTTTSTVAPVETTTTSQAPTETTVPGGPPLATQGDNNDQVAGVQFLLNCNGYSDMKVDGAFGPATLSAV